MPSGGGRGEVSLSVYRHSLDIFDPQTLSMNSEQSVNDEDDGFNISILLQHLN